MYILENINTMDSNDPGKLSTPLSGSLHTGSRGLHPSLVDSGELGTRSTGVRETKEDNMKRVRTRTT